MRGKVSTYLMAFAVTAGLCGYGTKAESEVLLIVRVPTIGMNCVSSSNIISCQGFVDYTTEKLMTVYEATDISVGIEVFDYMDENEAILGAYGTGDAVGILYEGYFGMVTCISEGHVVPLDDIITDGIRGDINESA